MGAIKVLFTIPPCKVCEIKVELEAKLNEEIRYLRQQVEVERREKAYVQEKLLKAVRLDDEGTRTFGGDVPISIRGIVSPARQRATAEAESRKEYWSKKAKAVENIQLGDS